MWQLDQRISSFHFSPSRCYISESMIETQDSPLPPSKRAARRIIQRAFVLTGRDRQLRQHIREVQLTTLWSLDDWELVWTVVIDRGKIEFERRPAKHPDMTLSWQTADEFFSRASRSFRTRRGTFPPSGVESAIPPGRNAPPRMESAGVLPESVLESAPSIEHRRIGSQLLNCFFGYLGDVLRNPVDSAGVSLL